MKQSVVLKIAYRFLGCFLAVVMLCAGFSDLSAQAKSTTEIKNEIADLEAKSAELEKEISKLKKDKSKQVALRNTLQSQINNTQSKIDACTRIIAGYNAEIEAHRQEIKEKNEQISETKFLFKKRMRSIYMSGSTNNELLILLDADSFADYLSLSEVSKTISAHDKKLVTEMSEAIEAINNANKEINEKINAQNAVMATLANEQAKLKSQRSDINAVISDLNSDQSALEKENKQYEAAIAALESQIRSELGSTTNNPVFVSGQFTWPLPGYYTITSPFNCSCSVHKGKHKGIDLAGANVRDKPIVAAADGVVLNAGYNNGGYGYWVVINHGMHNGVQYSTLYGHMIRNPVVRAGQTVKAGQHIGNVGTTGNSYGNHLHFEIRVNGTPVNPMNYFSKVR
jgi:murein DD-endopeptidase MepM/ murein hydrolase activator NlpD